MIELLADVNLKGQFNRLISLLRSSSWQYFTDDLQLVFLEFEDVGLVDTATDAEVYELCQSRGCYLITNNRNEDGPTSLGTAIKQNTSPESLPVFTISDGDSVNRSKAYAEKVVASLIDYLLRIDTLHGTGRLYLP